MKSDVIKYVALLRGINVGGKNKLPMRDLVRIFAGVGCAEVQTYIQSGNVIFEAKASVTPRLPGMVSEKIASEFGLRVPVVLRSEDQWRQAIADNPFIKEGAEEQFLHVVFLADVPKDESKDESKDEPKGAAALDANRSPGDRFVLAGREIYLHLPNGVADSKLTNAYFDRQLATVSTIRNWRTVLKIGEFF